MEQSPQFNAKIQSYLNAITGFKKIFNLDIELLDEVQIDAINNGKIQKFEYCVELSWKLIKQFNWLSGCLETKSPKSAIKTFFQTGYIDENQCETFILMIEDRNKLSYLYNEENYTIILQKLPQYLELLELILNIIENNNNENKN